MQKSFSQPNNRALSRMALFFLAYAAAVVMNIIGLTVGGLMKADCSFRMECAIPPEVVALVWCIGGVLPVILAHALRSRARGGVTS